MENTVRDEKNRLPNTFMTYCRRHGGLDGYVLNPETLICRADYFKWERPDSLNGAKCIYQENKNGEKVCCNGDITRHFEIQRLERERSAKSKKELDKLKNIGKN